MLVSRVLALLAALLVVWRVMPPTSTSLAAGTGTTLTVTATVLLLVAALAFVLAASAYGVTLSSRLREWFAGLLVAFVLVMAGYLGIGLALGVPVPWTAYAVLVGVAALGSGALVLPSRADDR